MMNVGFDLQTDSGSRFSLGPFVNLIPANDMQVTVGPMFTAAIPIGPRLDAGFHIGYEAWQKKPIVGITVGWALRQ